MVTKKEIGRKLRHKRIRKKIFGTQDRPRLSVYKSLKNLHAQLIDDISGNTLFSLSTSAKTFKKKQVYGGNVKAAQILGEAFAEEAKKKGIEKVIFDRSGFKYHGRLKSFADAVRKGGLKF